MTDYYVPLVHHNEVESPLGTHPLLGYMPSVEGPVWENWWFQCGMFKDDNGVLRIKELIVLADLLYWSEPGIVMEEPHGQSLESIGYQTRYGEEYLNRNSSYWETKFGFTKKEVKDILTFLIETGLIEETKRIEEKNGVAGKTTTEKYYYRFTNENISRLEQLKDEAIEAAHKKLQMKKFHK